MMAKKLTQREIKQQMVDHLETKISIQDNGCWLWTGSTGRDGYGVIRLDSLGKFNQQMFIENRTGKLLKNIQAHRYAFFAYGGKLTKAKPLVLHSCGNKACCNPNHLRAGDQTENMADKLQHTAKKYCKEYRKRPSHISDKIKQDILDGVSLREISFIYGLYLSSVRGRAITLQKAGYVVPQLEKDYGEERAREIARGVERKRQQRNLNNEASNG
jgi:hypothetical protein